MFVHLVFLFNLVSAQNFNSFSDGVNKFGIELTYFTHNEVNKSIAMSPFGVWSVLTGISAGATGISRKQLLEALRLPPSDDIIKNNFKNLADTVLNNKMLQSKNNLYYHMNISLPRDFEQVLQDNFTIRPIKLDFHEAHTAALVANRLVLDAGITTEKVLNDRDFSDAVVILTSVVKLRGFFRSPFNKENTRVESFYVQNEVKKVNMMQQTGRFLYSQIDDIQAEVIELPYTHNLSMIIVLPNDNVSLQYVYHRFISKPIKDLVWNLKTEGKKTLSVSIPRFRINSNFILNIPLIAMKVEIFVHGASFGKVDSDFFVSKLSHVTDIEVKESGGNTAKLFKTTNSFIANRPFIFFIIENATKVCVIGGVYETAALY